MKQLVKSYPPLDNLEGKSVEELLTLRQTVREVRDSIRVAVNDEITALQIEIQREGVNERRIFDIQLNDLKRQVDELAPNYGSPGQRVKLAELRDKISDLKFNYNMRQLDREQRLGKSANDRMRRQSQNQLEYESIEIQICKAIRDKDGFRQFGFNQQEVKTANDDLNTGEEN